MDNNRDTTLELSAEYSLVFCVFVRHSFGYFVVGGGECKATEKRGKLNSVVSTMRANILLCHCMPGA